LDLQIDEEHLKYLQCLDRGGLMYPSNMLFMVIQCSYSIFNMCVSSGMEPSFLKVENQRQTLISVIERYITSNDDFIGIYYVCDDCDVTFLSNIMKALRCFTNVLLNNYSKNNSDKLASSKQTRKLSKLS